MNNVEVSATLLAELYRKIDNDEIIREDLAKNAISIGISTLEMISKIALKNGNQKVYQTIVFACCDAITNKKHQK